MIMKHPYHQNKIETKFNVKEAIDIAYGVGRSGKDFKR